MRSFLQLIKNETVLSIAVLLALLSAFLVKPDSTYIGYIDFRTLAILFSLMAVMVGLRRMGVFYDLARHLLARTHSLLQIMIVLVLMCFFCSMIITNDVALLTFVPFTFVVLKLLGQEKKQRYTVPVVCMQTIAANLGSMLTPLGNPQNLYLYGRSGLSFAAFIKLMLPYTFASLVGLLVWMVVLCTACGAGAKGRKLTVHFEDAVDFAADDHSDSAHTFDADEASRKRKSRLILYSILFGFCLLTVFRVLDYRVTFGIVLISLLVADRLTLKQVDYSLLFTFVGFFIFIGNLGRIQIFSDWIGQIIVGREVVTAVVVSQVTSNVPAALLLSGFSTQYEALIIGLNLGGLGTLIASMASLISFRFIAREDNAVKGRYFLQFTLWNIVFLAGLMFLWYAIG